MRSPPPLHSRFQRGVSGNPGGRSKYYLDRAKIKRLIDKFLSLNKNELEKVINDKENVPAIELMIASTILCCIKAGDYSRLEALLSRAIGKVKDDISDDEENVDVQEQISTLSMNELLTLVKSTPKESTE